MEVKFLRNFVSVHGSHHVGRSLEVPDDLAKKWIASGHAEEMKPKRAPKKKIETKEIKELEDK